MPKTTSVYKVTSNEFEFSFSEADIAAADFVKKSPDIFNLIMGYRSVNARLISENPALKKLSIEVEGEIFTIEIRDELDQVLEKMGFGKIAARHPKEIKAPMPGLVLEIAVKEGQEVKQGDKILILEAMKMENSIVIHADAIIRKILVSPGQAVEKGQVLVELNIP
jgi:biotin carboxyl carrier protein